MRILNFWQSETTTDSPRPRPVLPFLPMYTSKLHKYA